MMTFTVTDAPAPGPSAVVDVDAARLLAEVAAGPSEGRQTRWLRTMARYAQPLLVPVAAAVWLYVLTLFVIA